MSVAAVCAAKRSPCLEVSYLINNCSGQMQAHAHVPIMIIATNLLLVITKVLKVEESLQSSKFPSWLQAPSILM